MLRRLQSWWQQEWLALVRSDGRRFVALLALAAVVVLAIAHLQQTGLQLLALALVLLLVLLRRQQEQDLRLDHTSHLLDVLLEQLSGTSTTEPSSADAVSVSVSGDSGDLPQRDIRL